MSNPGPIEGQTHPVLATAVPTNDTTTETTPLLDPEAQAASSGAVTAETEEVVEKPPPRLLARRLIWAIFLGLIALLILHLFFRQRTLVMRDFRRWHGLHFPYVDVKTSFLQYTGIANQSLSHEQASYIGEWVEQLSELRRQLPVNLASLDNSDLTQFVFDQFKQLGLTTEIRKTSVNGLDTPVDSGIWLKANDTELYHSSLRERPRDPTPAYYGFGVDGTVEGDYVWLNYGTANDYEKVDVTDKIVILRLRTNNTTPVSELVHTAASRGALAVLVYVDVTDHSLRRARLAIPRATLTDIFGAQPPIVALPVAYNDIKPILDTFDRNEAQELEAVPQPGYILRVSAQFDTPDEDRTVKNVVGTLPGVMSDGKVVIGAARDAFGNADGVNNHAIIFEIIRHLQELKKIGWRPMRTIEFILWDALNNGLVGSRHFVLNSKYEHLVGYINVEPQPVTGNQFHVDASPLLYHLINSTLRFIPVPLTLLHKTDEDDDNDDYDDIYDNRTTLHEVWKQQSLLGTNDVVSQLTGIDAFTVGVGLNCPVINVKFTANSTEPYVANSNLFGLEWMQSENVDTDYERHLLLVRHLGLLTILMSEREIVEYGVEHYMRRLADYLHHWHAHADPNDLEATVATSSFSGWQLALRFDTDTVSVEDIFQQVTKLLDKAVATGAEIDAVSDEALQGVRTDYAWYRYHKKLLHYAQFKASNYRLLWIEAGFKLDERDRHYLHVDDDTSWDHVVYAPGQQAFPGLWRANGDSDAVARWLVVVYDKMYRYHDYRVI